MSGEMRYRINRNLEKKRIKNFAKEIASSGKNVLYFCQCFVK
jgi:hypothetical protein